MESIIDPRKAPQPCTTMLSILALILPSSVRTPGLLWISPVDAFEQIAHLRRCYGYAVACRHRPEKAAPLQALRVEGQAEPIRGISTGRRDVLETRRDRLRRDRARALPGSAATGHSCRDACRCGPWRSTPARRTEPGSSPVQHVEHAGQCLGVNGTLHHQAPAPPHLDHHPAQGGRARSSPARRYLGRGGRLRRDHSGYKAWDGLGSDTLDLQNPTPRHEL